METWIKAINQSLPLPQTSSIISAMGQALPGDDQIDSKLAECIDKRNYHRDSLRSENMDNPADRELPSIPIYQHYDTPNPVCRAVIPESKFDQLPSRSSTSLSSSPQETFYHSIDESIAEQLARYDYPVRNVSHL